MASTRVDLSLPGDLNKRLEEYIRKHYRAYISGRGLKAEIITEALREWLDKHEG
jgi:metal-responsive CopG/Arc/MetJ family transcriptional regulator